MTGEPVLAHIVPPWADSGYGTQAKLMICALRDLGYQVGLSVFAGVHEARTWNGFPVYPTGGKLQGNSLIAYNARRHGTSRVIIFVDAWTIDPGQLEGLDVIAWMPVDQEPLSVMNHSWITSAAKAARSLHLVAMSAHGQRVLREAGHEAVIVPHAVQPELYPDPDAGRAWRAEMRIPPGVFIVGKIGVSDSDDRKAYDVTLPAFAAAFGKRSDVGLYLHTESFIPKGPDLGRMAAVLGLGGKAAFADQERRRADGYTVDDMRAVYNGIDVLDAVSRGEGFGVPVVESLACGTPVIGARNSAIPEKIQPAYGWLVSCQLQWARHHQAWWATPLTSDLVRAYQKAHASARSMRTAAAKAGAKWSTAAMSEAWGKALAGI